MLEIKEYLKTPRSQDPNNLLKYFRFQKDSSAASASLGALLFSRNTMCFQNGLGGPRTFWDFEDFLGADVGS
jgi:hypothetical protein